MAEPDADRRAALIAAAVDGSLTEPEQHELDRLRSTDPAIDREITDLRAVVRDLSAVHGGWDDTAPPRGLRDRILALESESAATGRLEQPANDPERRDARVTPLPPTRRWLLGLAAAACVVVGAGGVIAVQSATPASDRPGTLGAVEEVDFTGEARGVMVDGSLVAHTWGTETILEIDGLPTSDRYAVVLVARDGDSIESGTFFGSSVTIDCRMNAAVMRADIAGVEIQDAAGRVVAEASVPDAS